MQVSEVLDTAKRGDELVNSVDAAVEHGEQRGLRPLRYVISQDVGPGVEVHIWQGAAADESLRIVEDQAMDAAYAVVGGPDAAAFLAALGEELGLVSPDELRRRVSASVKMHPDAAMLLALSDATAAELATRSLLAELIASDEAAVVSASINSAILLRDASLAEQIRAAQQRWPEGPVSNSAAHFFQTVTSA